MAFSEAERTHITNLLEKQSELLLEKWKEIPLETYNEWLKSDLKDCDVYIWPFSAFMRFLVRRRYKQALKRMDDHSSLRTAQLNAEYDSITANIDESMKNISLLQRSKEDGNGIHNVRNA